MAEPIATYSTRVRGFWNPRHTLLDAAGRPQGVLTVRRNRLGLVVSGEYQPESGEVLVIRRNPGLLRAQFFLWTEGREWLASSMRWNVLRREITIWSGTKPYRVVPRSGFRRGWRIVATKTGEVARIRAPLLGRGCTLEVFRKLDLEVLLFCYFLGSLTMTESLRPPTLAGPEPRRAPEPTASGVRPGA
ncbi:MAG: hypothetical protein V3T22_04325 [Planctomycetota bacterium]